jgi:hypothetical protein
MSQQEFFQGLQAQGQQPLDEEAIEQPYYWSSKPNQPKEEHVLHYDEPMGRGDYQDGYMAQDRRSQDSAVTNRAGGRFSEFQAYKAQVQSQKQEQQRFSPDGDAFEQQYRPYISYNRSQWSVPPWARPQKQNKRWSRMVLFVIVALLLIKPLLVLFAIFGALVLAVVIPLVIMAFMLIIPFGLILLVSLPYILARGRTSQPFPQGRWRYPNYWRRRWW